MEIISKSINPISGYDIVYKNASGDSIPYNLLEGDSSILGRQLESLSSDIFAEPILPNEFIDLAALEEAAVNDKESKKEKRNADIEVIVDSLLSGDRETAINFLQSVLR